MAERVGNCFELVSDYTFEMHMYSSKSTQFVCSLKNVLYN